MTPERIATAVTKGRPGQQEPAAVEVLTWLRTMIRIRCFEETLARLCADGVLPGVVHLSIGQEAVAVGICSTLEANDMITSTHRGHHHLLARGLDPRFVFAEILGKETGYCRGKGGSMHVAHFAGGVAGANGIVGAGLPIAVGLATAAKEVGSGIAVAFFGDGAANTGTFHESLNLAALWRTPVVFCCENNGFTEFTPVERVTSGPGIAQRAAAYGIPGVAVDGDDVRAVHRAGLDAVHRARTGKGPTLVECRTVRWRGHHEGEERYAGTYREPSAVADPLDRCQALLQELEPRAAELRTQVTAEETGMIAAALKAAQSDPPPRTSSAFEDVFV